METRRQGGETSPIADFGTSPNLGESLKQTTFAGVLLKERYQIEGELGRGGIGVVYLARDTQLLNRRVVIKVLLDSSENSLHQPWFRKKFEQEIEALVRLDHPGVVGVLDAGAMPDGKPFFVMQYVQGVPLRTVMEKGRLEFPRAAEFIRQIGQALTAAHELGVVHRDLKPENVMVQSTSDGQDIVKLIDFGIATVRDSQVATQSEKTKVAGALPYMAPEQLRGQPEGASDLWSLAVMAYEMVTGHLPFHAETLVQLHEAQRGGLSALPQQLRPDLPQAAQDSILKALSFDARDRQARARDFGEEFAQAFSAPPITTPLGVAQRSSAPTMNLAQALAEDPTLLSGGYQLANQTASARTEQLPSLDAPAEPLAKPRALQAVAAVLALLVVGGIVWALIGGGTGGTPSPSPSPVPVVVTPQPVLSFSIKYKTKGKDLESAGVIVFSPGDQLRFNFVGRREGYLYIVNEGPKPKNGLPRYVVLFPAPALGGDAPSLKVDQTLNIPPKESGGFDVDDEAGTEILWLTWSAQKVNELEQIRKWHNAKDIGEIKDASEIRAVQAYLSQNYPAAKPVAELGDGHTELKIAGDKLMIYKLPIEHR